MWEKTEPASFSCNHRKNQRLQRYASNSSDNKRNNKVCWRSAGTKKGNIPQSPIESGFIGIRDSSDNVSYVNFGTPPTCVVGGKGKFWSPIISIVPIPNTQKYAQQGVKFTGRYVYP